MDAGIKITQIRVPVKLYERISEKAHETRRSRNQTMVEALKDGLDMAKLREMEG